MPTRTSALTFKVLLCNADALSHAVARGKALKIICIEPRITTHFYQLYAVSLTNTSHTHTDVAHALPQLICSLTHCLRIHLCSSTGWLVCVCRRAKKKKKKTHKGIFRSPVEHDFLLQWRSHGCQNRYTSDTWANNAAIYSHWRRDDLLQTHTGPMWCNRIKYIYCTEIKIEIH